MPQLLATSWHEVFALHSSLSEMGEFLPFWAQSLDNVRYQKNDFVTSMVKKARRRGIVMTEFKECMQDKGRMLI